MRRGVVANFAGFGFARLGVSPPRLNANAPADIGAAGRFDVDEPADVVCRISNAGGGILFVVNKSCLATRW